MAAPPLRAATLALLSVLLVSLLAGCTTRAPPEAGSQVFSDPGEGGDGAQRLASQTQPAGQDAPGGREAARPEAKQPAQGSIALRLTRETWDRPVPMEARFALYADFTDARGRAVDAPADASWVVVVAGAGPTQRVQGQGFPGYATLTLTQPGDYLASATAHGSGFTDGNAVVAVTALGPPPSRVILHDDANAITTLVADTRSIVYVPNADPLDLGKSTNDGWVQDGSVGFTGNSSWHAAYDDGTRANLTTPTLFLPKEGALLQFWIEGGAEDNGFDGLHVMSITPKGVVELAYYTGRSAAWTFHEVKVPGGTQQLQFRFDADNLCGDDGMPPTSEAAGVCSQGYDAGGYWLDDIDLLSV